MEARARGAATVKRMFTLGALALGLCAGLAACDSAATTAPPAALATSTASMATTPTPGGPPTPTGTPLPGAANLSGATDICTSPVNVSTTLPAEIPPYSGQLRLAQTSNGASVFGYCASASVDAIASFYTTNLPGKGWQNLQTFSNNATRNIIATRGGENLTITVSPDVVQHGNTDLLIIVNGQ